MHETAYGIMMKEGNDPVTEVLVDFILDWFQNSIQDC